MLGVQYILQRFAKRVAYVGLAAWGIGTIAALVVGNADLFQRFGALGNASAILFFSDRLAQIELERQKSVEKLLHEYGVELAALKNGVKPTELPKQGYSVDFMTEERNFDTLRLKADVFNIANVMLLTVSTMQWGFGDRLVTWLRLCEGAQC
ncbi:hypothetical protein [Tateyamaria sp. SN3-11]|uniref:hypothetical protein n=1 Tax=Tateyamaria sp. SN3-11 TaxID=3092147 RepID=UPI0039E9DB74